MKRILIIAQLLFATVFYAPELSAQAQIPIQEFGVGISAGSMNGGQSLFGISGVYALAEEFHVGAQLGFAIGSDNSTPQADNYWLFAPYAKLLFPIRNEFTPFLIGQFILDNGGTALEYVPGQEYETTSATRSSLFAGGGAEYFPSSTLGIYACVGLIDLGLSREETFIGLMHPRAGVEWFFQ